jgi:hypothetical protein
MAKVFYFFEIGVIELFYWLIDNTAQYDFIFFV